MNASVYEASHIRTKANFDDGLVEPGDLVTLNPFYDAKINIDNYVRHL